MTTRGREGERERVREWERGGVSRYAFNQLYDYTVCTVDNKENQFSQYLLTDVSVTCILDFTDVYKRQHVNT